MDSPTLIKHEMSARCRVNKSVKQISAIAVASSGDRECYCILMITSMNLENVSGHELLMPVL